ncbi:MAG: DUF4345 domain-containing protein [Pseudomonadales bacterium]
MKTVHTGVVLGFCYFFAAIALVTGTLALTLGLGLVPDLQVIEASSDNEFRFFSAFWLGYGGLCFWVARDLSARRGFIPALALVMFPGGVGRALSYALVGEPTPTYVIGCVVELVIPPLWLYSYGRLSPAADSW